MKYAIAGLMSQQYPNHRSWQHKDNIMYQSTSKFIALVFLRIIQLLCAKAILILNLRRILHPICPQLAHFPQQNKKCLQKNYLVLGRKNQIFRQATCTNPTGSYIYMPVITSFGKVTLVAAECKTNISQSAKSIVYGKGSN